MLKSYVIIGWRSLLRNRGYSFINVSGLALGLTVSILIGLWVHDELSFNTYHKNYDRIGQVYFTDINPETGVFNVRQSQWFPLGAALKSHYEKYFKHVLMTWWPGDCTLSLDEKKIVKRGQFIEAGAPEMLSLRMLKGTYAALKDPHSILLSNSTATAFFGTEDPMNKSIKINNTMDVIVTGVYEDLPANTQFGDITFFAPWSLLVESTAWIKGNENSWSSDSFIIYVQVESNTTLESVNAGISDFFRTYSLFKSDAEYVEKYKPVISLFPMSQWHLFSEFKDGKPSGGRITFVWLFGGIGIFVLMLACINFINLSTARSEQRAKEVGVRKVVGSDRSKLIYQFLIESFLVVVLAFLFAVVLVSLSLNLFNELADKNIVLPFNNLVFWIMISAFIALTSLMAGLYPAFYLSSFQPVKVLKGTFRMGRYAALPRKLLVVVQFSVSVMLILSTIIVYQQIQYARNRPLGYKGEGLISVPINDPNYKGRHQVLKTELYNTGMISQVALSSSPVTDIWNNGGGFQWGGRNPEKDNNFAICNVTHDFGKTIDWQLIEGRDFSKDFKSDSAAVILNETAVRYMDLKDPVGKYIGYGDNMNSLKIIGVIKDLVMQSPYEPVKQTIFFLDHNDSAAARINIKINPTVSMAEALPRIESVFKKIVPSASFDYKFVDEEYGQKFSAEERIGKLSGVFAVLAIFISCLGLLGLASFVAERRTKEIGIRKVLGASVSQLWQMLSKDFIVLIVISFLIAAPISYYFLHGWLERYTYRTEISTWIFLVTGFGAVAITLLTVSFQAIKAALMNPVKSLRSE
ncbi:MAG TPA: ABC transporter permease [Chryseolinea sp.]|nr:ABC transporter permease [Chryseolinea sp.]